MKVSSLQGTHRPIPGPSRREGAAAGVEIGKGGARLHRGEVGKEGSGEEWGEPGKAKSGTLRREGKRERPSEWRKGRVGGVVGGSVVTEPRAVNEKKALCAAPRASERAAAANGKSMRHQSASHRSVRRVPGSQAPASVGTRRRQPALLPSVVAPFPALFSSGLASSRCLGKRR